MKTAIVILLMLLAPLTSKSPNHIFDEYLDAPAVYYGAVSGDSVIHSYKRGSLSLTDDQAIDRNSQFALFSITKTFTAVAIMQLVENGSIHLDDKAIHFLPEYSFLGDITVRHLLSHQSGLNNPIPIRWIHLEEDASWFDYEGFSRKILKEKAKVKSKPGIKASYSNFNFLLLGHLIAKVSGCSYRDYVQQNVLNSGSIGFYWKDENTVTGYHQSGLQGLILALLLDKSKFTDSTEQGHIPFKKAYLNGSAHGGLIATPEGLNHYLQELLRPEGQILSAEMKRAMFAEAPLADGRPSGHSLGWFTGSLNGERYVHHAGGGGGFYLELRVYPDRGVATYVLTNKSGFSDQRVLDKLDAWKLRI